MTPRTEGLILTAAPCIAAITCAVIGKTGWAAALGILGIATAATTAFRRQDTDERDEKRARIGAEDT